MEVPDPVKWLGEKGMQVVVLSPEQLEAFRAATRPVFDKWSKEVGDEVFAAAKADMAN